MSTVRHVTIPKAAIETGYTQDAIRTKIKSGVWLEGKLWIKGPDGRILIDLEGYEAWVTGATSLQHQKPASASASAIAGSPARSE